MQILFDSPRGNSLMSSHLNKQGWMKSITYIRFNSQKWQSFAWVQKWTEHGDMGSDPIKYDRRENMLNDGLQDCQIYKYNQLHLIECLFSVICKLDYWCFTFWRLCCGYEHWGWPHIIIETWMITCLTWTFHDRWSKDHTFRSFL